MRVDFKPMFAGTYTGKYPIKFPVITSPKIDGIRCIIVDGVPMTRSLKSPIPNVFAREQLMALCRGHWLDGELIVGNVGDAELCANTVSGIMSKDGEPDWSYLVFDHARPSYRALPYHERLLFVDVAIAQIGSSRIRRLESCFANDNDELFALEDAAVMRGFEGLMYRTHNGPYKHGRATEKEGTLIKIKRWEDAEGIITGVFEEMENTNEAKLNALGKTERSSHKANKVGKGRLGGYKVQTKRFEDFRFGLNEESPGVLVDFDLGAAANSTALAREAAWNDKTFLEFLIGKQVTFKYQVTNGAELPRFPTFKLIRPME